MKSRETRLLVAWTVAADAAAAVAAFLLAFPVRFHFGIFAHPLGVPAFRPYAYLLPFVALLWPLAYATQRLYRPARRRSLIDETFALGVGNLLASLLLFLGAAYYRLYNLRGEPGVERFEYSRLFFLVFLGLAVPLAVAARALIRSRVAAARRRGLHLRRVLVAGASELGRTVVRKMKAHPDYGFEVVGFVDDDPARKGAVYEGAKVLGTTGDVLGLVREEKVDELVLALPWSAHEKMIEILEDTSKEYLDIKIVPDLLEYIALRAGIEDLDGLPVLNLAEEPLHASDWLLKRAFDIAASAAGLVLLSPLFGVIAWLVRRSSPGPILYTQERMGLDGKSFTMYKFRSMYVDAETHTGPVFAADVDARATPIGAWLRRYSLDELPQLWNVLRGDMSIVGPRPERPSFVAQFKDRIPQYMLRHRMKCGITGWAQVNGWRGNTSIPMRIEHDLYYMANWSFAFDLKIVWLTLLKGFRHRSAGAVPPL